MAKLVFVKILEEGVRKGKLALSTRQARKWYQNKGRVLKQATPRTIWSEKERWKHSSRRKKLLGNCYYFFYEPIGKDKMPYYDAFPIVFPIELTEDGFLGLNFHYLDIRLRAVFMDRLLALETPPGRRLLGDDSKQSEKGKLDWRKIRYERLSHQARHKYFRPCLKRYKFSQMRSRMIQLEKDEWDVALFLPTDRFVGASNKQVWQDSRHIIQRKQ